VLATVAQRLRHPEELVQELVDREERVVDELAARVEAPVHAREVHVPEDRHEAQLAQHRKQVLNAAGAAEHAGGDSDDAGRLVDVLLEVRVDHVLEHTGVAVVVLGRDEDQTVGAVHRLRESGVLRAFARVVERDRQGCYVDQLGLDARPLGDLLPHHPSRVLAHPAHPRRTEQDRDEERPRHPATSGSSPTRCRNT
jgi:hypothetical protein